MKEKRIRIVMLCCVLAAALSLSLLAAPLVTATENAELLSGTIHDIYTAADLAQMANGTDIYYLRNDLDLTSWGNWTPIHFGGTFDGQGHTIKGLVVSGYTEGAAGLFDSMSGTVRNLNLEVDITGYYDDETPDGRNAGGLAGLVSGGAVDCVSVSGKVRGARMVGGVVGECNGTISNSFSSANVSNVWKHDNVPYWMYGSPNCGGLAGYANEIRNCYAIGTVSATNRTACAINGLVGSASVVTPVSKFLRQRE